MMPGCSRNWRRTSCTMVPAERPTALMAAEENRKAIDPPTSMPMKIFGLATLMAVETLVNSRLALADGVKALSCWPMVWMKAGEQGQGGDDGRADGEALGHGLGGVADGVEAGHDPLRLAENSPLISAMPAALSDTGP